MVRRLGDGGYRVLPCHGSAWFRLMAAAMIATGGVVLGMSVSAFGASTAAPHVMVIMMENKNFSDVIGQADQPYTNELATNGGLATDSYSMVTGSLPNYLAIISGSTQNDTDNVTPSQVNFPNTATLADQLATAGYTAKAYAEGLPADPSTNSGTYEVDHFPWPYFPNAQITSADSSTLLSDLDSADAPDFVWYSPNNIDDEDSGTVQQGDAFLSSLVPQVQATPWYQDGGKIIIEWDESNNDTTGINGGTGGGRIPTIVVSAALSANPQQDSTPVDTVGILHSIENVYGLPYLTGAADPSNGNIDALLDEGSGTARHRDHGTAHHDDHGAAHHDDHGAAPHDDYRAAHHDDHGAAPHDDYRAAPHDDHGAAPHDDYRAAPRQLERHDSCHDHGRGIRPDLGRHHHHSDRPQSWPAFERRRRGGHRLERSSRWFEQLIDRHGVVERTGVYR